jgi:hypothetical protein
MRHLLFRFSVALVAFIVGVLTATAFAALFGLGAAREGGRQYNYEPLREKKRPCPSQRYRRLSELPPPPPAPVQRLNSEPVIERR